MTIADGAVRQADDVLLPEGTRLLHIGPHKTGTTTLQGAFHAARRKVERQGVHYASPNRQAKQAALAVARRPSPYTGGKVPPEAHWTSLLRDVEQSGAKRILISAEAFADAGPEAVWRMIADLDPPTVHVVATLRPLPRILPSQWQQYVQNGLAKDYNEWLAEIFDQLERPESSPFWHRHRHDALIARWAEVVGPEKMTVVVVDDRDHEASLRTFERMLGLRADTLQPAEGIYNRSLTRAEVRLVQALHGAFTQLGMEKALRLSLVLHGAAANMKLREPGPDEPRIETPPWALERVASVAREIVAGIRASGVRVIGDLGILLEPPGAPRAGAGETPAEAWARSTGRGLLGVLTQTGMIRGHEATVGESWPDEGTVAPTVGRRPTNVVLAEWATPRLAGLWFGRVQSAAPSRLARPVNFVRRAVIGGRRRRAGRRRGRARGPSVDLAGANRDQRRVHDEDAE